jgi:hypothetical protein
MKRKMTKLRNCKNHALGVAVWRITGPCKFTNQRVTIEFVGTREEACGVVLRSSN